MLKLELLKMLIDWSNDIIDLSALDNFISQSADAFSILLNYIKGAFFILPFGITMSCLGVVLVVLVVRVVLAVVNLIYP